MPTTSVPSVLTPIDKLTGTRNRRVFRDDFTLLPKLNASANLNATFSDTEVEKMLFANVNWELSGTNAADTVAATSTGGGVTLTTTTSSADQVLVGGHTDSGVGALTIVDWSTSDGLVFYARIKTAAAIADMTFFAGLKLTSTPVIATDDDQVFVRYQDTQSGGNFELVTSASGTDETLDSGLAVAASTTYEIVIEVGESTRKATFFIAENYGDFTEVGQSQALTADVDLLPFFGVQTDEAAANAITVREVAVSKIEND